MPTATRLFPLAVVLGSVPAAAQSDAEPPQIVHYPCDSYESAAPFEVRANIVDASELYDPKVLYRVGRGDWSALAMQPDGGDVYVALIPAGSLGDVLEYTIETFDVYGNGPARAGSVKRPLRVEPSGESPWCDQITGAPPPEPVAPPGTEVIEAAEADPRPGPEVLEDAPDAGDGAAAVRLNARVEAGAAFLLAQPQVQVYDVGGGTFGAAVGGSLGTDSALYWLAVELRAGFVMFSGPGASGAASFLGLGARFTPFGHGTDGWGGPFVDGHFNYVRTGDLDRFAIDVGLGLDFAIGPIRLGPFVRYTHLVAEKRSGFTGDDAMLLYAGVGAGSLNVLGMLSGGDDS